jgi:hypothetical protein
VIFVSVQWFEVSGSWSFWATTTHDTAYWERSLTSKLVPEQGRRPIRTWRLLKPRFPVEGNTCCIVITPIHIIIRQYWWNYWPSLFRQSCHNMNWNENLKCKKNKKAKKNKNQKKEMNIKWRYAFLFLYWHTCKWHLYNS